MADLSKKFLPCKINKEKIKGKKEQ